MSHKCLFALGMCAATLLTATSADASLTLRLTDSAGGGPITITDGGAGDGSPLPGHIIFGGSVNTFFAVVEVGASKPLIGSATLPNITLQSSVQSSTKVGTSTLTIELSDDFFGPSADPLGLVTSFASPGTQLATLDSYIDTGNALFGTADGLSSFGPVGGLFSDSDVVSADTTPSPYSLTLIATLTHTGNQNSGFGAEIAVTPEPTTLLVWGGLVALVALPLRKRFLGA